MLKKFKGERRAAAVQEVVNFLQEELEGEKNYDDSSDSDYDALYCGE